MRKLIKSRALSFIFLAGSLSTISGPIHAQEVATVGDLPKVSTKAATLLAQTADLVKITGVKLNPTPQGVEVVLESIGSANLKPVTRTQGKVSFTDIPNVLLSLPDGKEFKVENPTKGIANISVTQVSPTFVRVIITGTDGLPTAQVVSNEQGLLITSIPTTTDSDDDEEDIVVTGEQNRGYRVPTASTATGTNTPILETPFSVQVIPQDIIRDQQITQVKEALSNVSGVTFSGNGQGRSGNNFVIRGFSTAPVLLDGFRRFGSSGAGNSQLTAEIAGLDRIEVLKGPASILYGAIEPGGLVNLVSKKPLANPFYELELQAGNRGLVRPRFDISGPLTEDGKVLYRLNGLYSSYSLLKDYTQPEQRFFIAPTISW